MNEAGKTILLNTVKEWTKFEAEREKLTLIAKELSAITAKVVRDALSVMKSQKVDVECESDESMKILGVPVEVREVIEATFPTVKASVIIKCAGAQRSILINPNLSISTGAQPVPYEQFKRGIPDAFMTNAAEFVRDAFLYVARGGPAKDAATPKSAQ
ncbi:MAG: hypothetical protein FJ215_09610 [Ignavibacteria bacterium]|nr:hypothetical protein [Ignavibacteria bacterium]